MEWNTAEVEQAASLASTLEAVAVARTVLPDHGRIVLDASMAAPLANGMRASLRGLPIRHLLSQMRLDEKRIFEWRVEHKLVQALLLFRYCGEFVPVTRGLGRALAYVSPIDLVPLFEKLQSKGYLIKAALGYCSRERDLVDRLPFLLEKSKVDPYAVMDLVMPCAVPDLLQLLSQERFIIQQRIDISQEYRVHSFEDSVVPGLTFHRDSSAADSYEALQLNHLVQQMLDRLPNALVSGVLYGWDIARTRDGRYYVVEINPTGFHPVYEPGFHCSGFFLGEDAGEAATAQFIAFLEDKYRLKVDIVSSENAPQEFSAYSAIAKWRRRLELRFDGRLIRSARVGSTNELILTVDAAQWRALPADRQQKILDKTRAAYASKACSEGPDIACVIVRSEAGDLLGRADPVCFTDSSCLH